MNKGAIIVVKFAIGVAVVALMGVVIKSWDRNSRYGVWDYDEEQLAAVRAGNHDWSDSLVNRALNYYMTGDRENGLKQIRIAQYVDSMYWVVWHAEGFMKAVDGNLEASIRLMRKSLDLNVDREPYVICLPDTLTEAQAWLYIAEGYNERYKVSGDDWELHFAKECVDAAEECFMCWGDRREANDLKREFEDLKYDYMGH